MRADCHAFDTGRPMSRSERTVVYNRSVSGGRPLRPGKPVAEPESGEALGGERDRR